MLQSSTTSSTISGTTGAVCNHSGPYKSSRLAKVTVLVRQGDQFPPDTDGASTTWSMTLQTETLTMTTM